jgi:segregation and condensation protein A
MAEDLLSPPRRPAEPGPQLILHLQGFDGPLELLLELARAQKVEIRQISILALVDQFLAFVEDARRVRLELAADWLVMAAWLAWLKSRLLVPEEATPEEDAEALALALTDRLVELEQMRAAAAWLAARPQLGRESFARGAPESLKQEDRSGIAADLSSLLQAYAAARRRALAQRPYIPKLRKLWTVQEAVERLSRLMGKLPGWEVLQRFLPEGLLDPVERRAAMAATLIAALETARGGGIELRQDRAFGPILLRPRTEEAPPDARAA